MIFLDSCILIYLVERTPGVYSLIERAMTRQARQRFAISPLVQMECLVGPLKDGDTSRQAAYARTFAQLVELPLSPEVYHAAARLRTWHNLKTPDALHLATARHAKCASLWTNDDRLIGAAPGFAVNIKSL